MRIYIVAGEPSGDLLASELMAALRKTGRAVEFRGVGGESMAGQGLESLFDIEQISVMGIFEVLPNLRRILRRIRETADDILRWQPDVLVTVDSWGFVSQLLRCLRKRNSTVPVVHYVAPQVWAWKKGRAKKVASLVDRLMTLLPDEGRYFAPYGLQSDFVGHPVIERMAVRALSPAPGGSAHPLGTHAGRVDTAGEHAGPAAASCNAAIHPTVTCDAEDFRRQLGLAPDRRVICVLPGSRRSEVDRLMPVLRDALVQIRRVCGDFAVVVPTVLGVEGRVRRFFAKTDLPARIVTGRENRYNAFCISDLALAASGTVSLELAAVGVPHLITYRFNAPTNLIAKLLVKIRFANLLNLLADKEIIPEFVLDNCRPAPIATCAVELLRHPETGREQVAEAQKILQRLRLPDMLPSERAAQVVLEAAGTPPY